MQVHISLGMSPELRKELDQHCKDFEVGLQSYIRTTLWSDLRSHEKKTLIDGNQKESKGCC